VPSPPTGIIGVLGMVVVVMEEEEEEVERERMRWGRLPAMANTTLGFNR